MMMLLQLESRGFKISFCHKCPECGAEQEYVGERHVHATAAANTSEGGSPRCSGLVETDAYNADSVSGALLIW